MTSDLVALISTLFCSVVVAVGAVGFQASMARKDAQRELNRQANRALARRAFNLRTPEPEPPIVAWTPAEREAFGVNDTERFIRETDRVLNNAAWAGHKAAARRAQIDFELSPTVQNDPIDFFGGTS